MKKGMLPRKLKLSTTARILPYMTGLLAASKAYDSWPQTSVLRVPAMVAQNRKALIMLPYFCGGVTFCIIVIEGDIQHSPIRYFKASRLMASQKFEVIKKVQTLKGKTRRAEMLAMRLFVRGCLFEYLSEIMPPNRAEIKPKTDKLRALSEAN